MGDSDEAWVADYFSVVGASSPLGEVVISLTFVALFRGMIFGASLRHHQHRSPNDGDLELLDPELHSPELLRCVWEDAITDIAVVRTGKGERCPEGYELIERTPMDHNADLNHGSATSWGLQRAVHLAVRRQHVSKRDDYIAEMQVVYGDSESLPEGPGWELVERSASGKEANLNKGGDQAMLAVRRVARDLVDCPAAVCSVCVLLRNKGEHPPPGYRVISKDLNKGKFGDVVQLAYQLGGALSMCRLPFRSMILDRYPEEDSPMFPFPGEQLPMFVHPKGMLLERRSGRDTPKSSFFSFVFTNIDGRRTYTACLTFYEPMTPSAARRLKRKLFTCAPDTNEGDTIGAEQATQGRMRMGLRGSVSSSRLSNISQTWSGVGGGGPTPWPRAFARGGMGSSGGAVAPTSWTKLSVVTRTPRYNFGQDGSPGQLSTAEIFSGADVATPDSHGVCSPSPPKRAGNIVRARNGCPVDGQRCCSDEPFREVPHPEIQIRTTVETSQGETKMSDASEPGVASTSVGDRRGASNISTESSDARRNEPSAPSAQESVGSNLCDSEYDLMCRSEDRECIFAPKTICVISRFPIYGVLRRFLRHLYAISLSRSGVPLERYISMFVSCIPMPPPGGCPFHVYLEPLENQDPRRSRLKPLTLVTPPDAWLPLMDIDFTAPFRCLSVQSVLAIFALMLQEAKIIFLSSRAELLTQVMEALRSLLFPMEWQSVYVPQLPYALAGYLECPGGFMIGMRLTKSELEKGTGSTATVVRDLGLEGVANAVNLDAGEVLLYSGRLADSAEEASLNSGEVTEHRADRTRDRRELNNIDGSDANSRRPKSSFRGLGIFYCRRLGRDGVTQSGTSFSSKDEETATPWLPESLHAGMASRLTRELIEEAGVRTGMEEVLDQYESAFEFAPAPDRTDTLSTDGYDIHRMHFSSERIKPLNTRDSVRSGGTSGNRGDCATEVREIDTSMVVRDCFLCCMTELLGSICDSVRQSEAKGSGQSLRTRPLDELFNRTAFLEGMNKDARPFLQRLTSTQMFWVMIQQWLGGSSTTKQLLFFEECAIAVKNRRAGAVVPRKYGISLSLRGKRHWIHERLIALVDEVYLKRPDLYGLNPYNLPASHLAGVRSTPLASPQVGGQGAWNARNISESADLWSEGSIPEHMACRSPSRNNEDDACELYTGPPVVIPGPTTEGLPEHVGGRVYRYDDGWPTPLKRSLLHTPPEALPPIVLKLQLHAHRRSSHHSEDDKGSSVHTPRANNRRLTIDPIEASSSQPCNRSGRLSPSNRAPSGSNVARKPGYRGDRRLWRPHGNGQMVFPDGRIYMGEWRQGQQHGQGSMESGAGNMYTGSWRCGKMNGEGAMTYPDGSRYDGCWMDGERHGEGTYISASGGGYRGSWEHGVMHGPGCYTSANGSRYEGTYRFGQRCGHGRVFYHNGKKYVGHWANGVRSGFGTCSSPNGTVFEGYFKENVKHGAGKLHRGDQEAVSQIWESGRLVETGVVATKEM